MTDGQPIDRCWRRCPQRINKIYFVHQWAGIGDRMVLLHMLGNMAGYMCATVELAPPSKMLTPIHNGNTKLDNRVEWKDFFNFTFLQDGSQVLYEAKDNPNFPPKVKNWDKSGLYKQNYYPGYILVVTKKGRGSIINDYRRAQDISWRQDSDTKKGFIWEIHRLLYRSRLVQTAPLPEPSKEVRKKFQHAYNGSMRPFMKSWKGAQREQAQSQSCNYVSRSQPDSLQQLQKELQNRVRSLAPANTSVFGFLHVRRNDATKECNTSLPNLYRFFQCSINGTEATGKHITFLLGSDEKSDAYRQNVMDMTNEYPHVSMLDADKLVIDFMKDMIAAEKMPTWLMNNYYQFELMKALGLDRSSFSSVFLVQRRSDQCPPCSKLMTEFPTVWA
ncbi:MAG: hypothetical protein SGBAC_012426 [Bacillariaceae sp.]